MRQSAAHKSRAPTAASTSPFAYARYAVASSTPNWSWNESHPLDENSSRHLILASSSLSAWGSVHSENTLLIGPCRHFRRYTSFSDLRVSSSIWFSRSMRQSCHERASVSRAQNGGGERTCTPTDCSSGSLLNWYLFTSFVWYGKPRTFKNFTKALPETPNSFAACKKDPVD